MNFSHALAALAEGKRVTRQAWVETAAWLVLVPGCRITVTADGALGEAAPELVGHDVDYLARIDLAMRNRMVQPWTPTQADLFAEGWVLVSAGLPPGWLLWCSLIDAD